MKGFLFYVCINFSVIDSFENITLNNFSIYRQTMCVCFMFRK